MTLLDEWAADMRGRIEAEMQIPDHIHPDDRARWHDQAWQRTAMMRRELERFFAARAMLEPAPSLIVPSDDPLLANIPNFAKR